MRKQHDDQHTNREMVPPLRLEGLGMADKKTYVHPGDALEIMIVMPGFERNASGYSQQNLTYAESILVHIVSARELQIGHGTSAVPFIPSTATPEEAAVIFEREGHRLLKIADQIRSREHEQLQGQTA